LPCLPIFGQQPSTGPTDTPFPFAGFPKKKKSQAIQIQAIHPASSSFRHTSLFRHKQPTHPKKEHTHNTPYRKHTSDPTKGFKNPRNETEGVYREVAETTFEQNAAPEESSKGRLPRIEKANINDGSDPSNRGNDRHRRKISGGSAEKNPKNNKQ
jgi:hypothetical protein